jgi:hypothetical protein
METTGGPHGKACLLLHFAPDIMIAWSQYAISRLCFRSTVYARS